MFVCCMRCQPHLYTELSLVYSCTPGKNVKSRRISLTPQTVGALTHFQLRLLPVLDCKTTTMWQIHKSQQAHGIVYSFWENVSEDVLFCFSYGFDTGRNRGSMFMSGAGWGGGYDEWLKPNIASSCYVFNGISQGNKAAQTKFNGTSLNTNY